MSVRVFLHYLAFNLRPHCDGVGVINEARCQTCVQSQLRSCENLHFWWHWAVCIIQTRTHGTQASCTQFTQPLWKGRKSVKHIGKILDWLRNLCLVVAVVSDFHHKDIARDITTEKQKQVHDHTGHAHNLDAAGGSMWPRQVVRGRGAVTTASDLSHFPELFGNSWMLHRDKHYSSCYFPFPSPQKNSCLLEWFCPSKSQCLNKIKSSLLSSVLNRPSEELTVHSR